MDHTVIENFPFYYIPFLIISSLEKRHFLFLHSNLVTHVVTSYDSREKAFSALEWYEIKDALAPLFLLQIPILQHRCKTTFRCQLPSSPLTFFHQGQILDLPFWRGLTQWGVANGTSKNVGRGKFWQDLEISEAFLTSLKISFFAWFARARISN